MITVLNFSGRKNGNCFEICKLICKHYNKTDVVLENINESTIHPCGNCDYECFEKETQCPILDGNLRIYNRIIQSDLVLFVVPNYCDYPNANYFAFNERSCGFFNKQDGLLEKYSAIQKKYIVISNTNTDHFLEVFNYQGNDNPDVLFLSAKRFGSVSLAGDLAFNPAVKDIVDDFLEDKYQNEESAMAVVLHDNKILTINESVFHRNVLSLPKGHIEYQESHLQAAIRECYEETNVILTKDDFIKEGNAFKIKFIDQNYKLVCKTIYPLLFKLSNKTSPKVVEERINEAVFMDLWRFIKNCSYDTVKNIVEQLVD